jgi:hypothetical protein
MEVAYITYVLRPGDLWTQATVKAYGGAPFGCYEDQFGDLP